MVSIIFMPRPSNKFSDPVAYAFALCDQALADYVCAEELLTTPGGNAGMTAHHYSHAIIAKLQQAVEKLLKGLLLHSKGDNFDPVGSHAVLKHWGNDTAILPLGNQLPNVFDQLKMLEELAPNPARIERDGQSVVTKIPCNTEYPFHDYGQPLTYPAAHFQVLDAIVFYEAVVQLMNTMSQNTGDPYSQRISVFWGRQNNP